MPQPFAWSAVLLAFIPLFVAVDPFGLLPIFVTLTTGLAAKKKAKVIRESLFTALVVAVIFLFVGRYLLRVLGVTVGDFMVAGGLLLFVLAPLSIFFRPFTICEASGALRGINGSTWCSVLAFSY